ncbi:MAG: transposase [Planctomycetota bacterium]
MRYRKHIRLSPELYKQTRLFFVTIVSRLRQPLFDGRIKQILQEEFKNIPSRFPGWNLDFFTIMPNHIHFIVSNSTEGNFSLGRIIGAYKSIVCKRLREKIHLNKTVWQTNYYEHIIRTEEELNKIRFYIIANPSEEKIDWTKIEDYDLPVILEQNKFC